MTGRARRQQRKRAKPSRAGFLRFEKQFRRVLKRKVDRMLQTPGRIAWTNLPPSFLRLTATVCEP